MSYISNDTFFENKYGFAEDDLNYEPIPTLVISSKKPIHLNQVFCKKLLQDLQFNNKFTFDIQVRGFKTDRSIKAESDRNPSLVSRVKNVFIGSDSSDVRTMNELALNNERFGKILNQDPNMTDAEKQRMKVAFAEGYLLGSNPNMRTGKATKYFKIVQQVLTIVIFFAIVVSLMASANGSIFR